MIFEKFISGSFGILMYQKKGWKKFVFQGCAIMMLWLQLDSILNGLSPQIPTKHPKQLRHTKIPPRYNNTLPLSQKLQETSQDSSRHHYKTPPDIFKHSKGLSGAVVFVKWNQGGAIMPFWHNPEIQDFFRLILFKHQNSKKKNTPYKLFNNY